MSAHREVVAKLEPATLTHPAGAASAGGVFYWARAFGVALCFWDGAASVAVSPRRVQITLKPAAKGLRMHSIFVGGKGRKYVIAHSALKTVQVHAWAFWLDADEHHPSFAQRTGGALKCSRRNGGQRTSRLGHGNSLRIGGSTALSSYR